jgi:hypothetical protein
MGLPLTVIVVVAVVAGAEVVIGPIDELDEPGPKLVVTMGGDDCGTPACELGIEVAGRKDPPWGVELELVAFDCWDTFFCLVAPTAAPTTAAINTIAATAAITIRPFPVRQKDVEGVGVGLSKTGGGGCGAINSPTS